jgi:hypothetical protein
MTSHLIENSRSAAEMRRFGFLMGLVFGLLFGLLLPLLHRQSLPLWPWGILAGFWFPACFWPTLLSPVYCTWMKIGHYLGWINSRLLLGLIYCVMIIPIGLLLQVFGKARIKNMSIQGDSFRILEDQRPLEHFERIF